MSIPEDMYLNNVCFKLLISALLSLFIVSTNFCEPAQVKSKKSTLSVSKYYKLDPMVTRSGARYKRLFQDEPGKFLDTRSGARYERKRDIVKSINIIDLPFEMIEKIFTNLSLNDLFNCEEVCLLFKSVISEKFQSLYLKQKYPQLTDKDLNEQMFLHYKQYTRNNLVQSLSSQDLEEIDGMSESMNYTSLLLYIVVRRCAKIQEDFDILGLLHTIIGFLSVGEDANKDLIAAVDAVFMEVRDDINIFDINNKIKKKKYKEALCLIRENPMSAVKFIDRKGCRALSFFDNLKRKKIQKLSCSGNEEIIPLDCLGMAERIKDPRKLLLKYLVSYKNNKLYGCEEFQFEAKKKDLRRMRDEDNKMRELMDDFTFTAPTGCTFYPFRDQELMESICTIL